MTGSVAGLVAALAKATGAPTASAAMTAANAPGRLVRNMMHLLLLPGGRSRHPWIVDRALSTPVCAGILSPWALAAA
jgi:hypothetical protein